MVSVTAVMSHFVWSVLPVAPMQLYSVTLQALFWGLEVGAAQPKGCSTVCGEQGTCGRASCSPAVVDAMMSIQT